MRDGGVALASSPARGDDAALNEQWARVRARLQAEVGEVEYRTWLKQMALAGLDGDEVTVILPTRFLRDWVNKEYGELITAFWQAENPRSGMWISAPAAGRRRGAQPCRAGSGTAPAAAPAVPAAPAAAPRPELVAPLDPRFTFDAFVVGKPNEFAYACARRVAERAGQPGLQSAVPVWRRRPGQDPSDARDRLGADATRTAAAAGLGRLHVGREIHVPLHRRHPQPVHDGVQGTAAQRRRADDRRSAVPDRQGQHAGRIFPYLQLRWSSRQADRRLGRQVAVRPERAWSIGCAPVWAAAWSPICTPRPIELRISILEAKAARAGVEVPGKVLEFLAHKITSNVRELEGALNRLVAHANLFGRPVTLETTHEVLHDILKAHDRRVTIEEIQKQVAEHYNIRLTDMSSARRARAVARPRQVAMYLAKQLTSRSLPEIGRKFGNRDHTTVMHAVSRVTELMEPRRRLRRRRRTAAPDAGELRRAAFGAKNSFRKARWDGRWAVPPVLR